LIQQPSLKFVATLHQKISLVNAATSQQLFKSKVGKIIQLQCNKRVLGMLRLSSYIYAN